MSKVGELDRDVMDCGGPVETWQEMVKHLRWRAANSRGLSRDSRKASEGMAEDANFFAAQAEDFDALASSLESANITFAVPALAAATREGGDVQQAPCEASQSGPKGNAQNPPPKDKING